MLKRILQLIVVLLIAAQGVMAQTVQIVSVTQPPGDVSVQVDMLGFTGSNGSVAAITFKIGFNPDLLDFNGITNTQLTGSWVANASGNYIMITYTSSSAGVGYDINGKAFDLQLHYKGGFTGDLAFETSACEVSNSSLAIIPATYTDGSVSQSTAVGSVSMTYLTDTIGNAVSMPVTMQGAGLTAVSSFTFVVQYDESQLSYTGVTGSVVTGLTASASDGVLTIEWTGAASDFSSATHLFDIGFTYVWGDADITFAPGCEVDDSGLNPLAVDYTDGDISSVAATRSLTILNVAGTTDSVPVQVNVPVVASGFTGDNVGAITLKFNYDDTKLTYRSYTADQLSGWTVNNVSSGTVTFMWSSNSGSPILDDNLIELIFDYDTAGGLANISFAGGTIIKDDQSVTIPTTYTNGSIANFSVSGQLTYNGDATRPICTKNSSVTTVYLKNAADSTIAYTTTADTAGNYVFSSVAVGNYFLDASSTIDTKYGYDNTDAFLIYGTGSSMTGIIWKAANVNEDNFVDNSDAFIVYGSVAGGNNRGPSWSAPEWVFENPTVTVSGSNVTQDFVGLSSGDSNGDFVPVP